jgi:hypothetical protein
VKKGTASPATWARRFFCVHKSVGDARRSGGRFGLIGRKEAHRTQKKGIGFESSAPLCGYSSGVRPLQYMQQQHLLLSCVAEIEGLM